MLPRYRQDLEDSTQGEARLDLDHHELKEKKKRKDIFRRFYRYTINKFNVTRSPNARILILLAAVSVFVIVVVLNSSSKEDTKISLDQKTSVETDLGNPPIRPPDDVDPDPAVPDPNAVPDDPNPVPDVPAADSGGSDSPATPADAVKSSGSGDVQQSPPNQNPVVKDDSDVVPPGSPSSGESDSRGKVDDPKLKTDETGSGGAHVSDDTRDLKTKSPEAVPAAGGYADEEKRQKIKEMMKHAWDGYDQKCFGQDELKPTSESCNNWMGLGLTLVDSLDVLYLMGMTEEFNKARDWVADHLDLARDKSMSFFETTIRVLGGLLSAFDMSKDQVFLEKARDLGDRLLKAFNSGSGLPKGEVNLKSGATKNADWSGGSHILAEIGTVQLEFKYLSEHTGDKKYGNAADKVVDILDGITKPYTGLYPIYVRGDPPRFSGDFISFGAMGDSWYEYLLKLWIQTGKSKPQYKRMYQESMEGLFDKLYRKHPQSGLYYLADISGKGGRLDHKMDHLACFASGMLALGTVSDILDTEEQKEKHLDAAKELARTCVQMYKMNPSGLAGEFVRYPAGSDVRSGNANFNIGRPETVESLFILWRITHDPIYREWGWEIAQAFEAKSKMKYGYASVLNVGSVNPTPDHNGVMQSFFLAETLKYLYLLYSDDSLIPLDKYVFNTEAHPLSVFQT